MSGPAEGAGLQGGAKPFVPGGLVSSASAKPFVPGGSGDAVLAKPFVPSAEAFVPRAAGATNFGGASAAVFVPGEEAVGGGVAAYRLACSSWRRATILWAPRPLS